MSTSDHIGDGAPDDVDATDELVTVGGEQPTDAAEEWAAAQRLQRPRPVRAGSTPLRGAGAEDAPGDRLDDGFGDHADGAGYNSAVDDSAADDRVDDRADEDSARDDFAGEDSADEPVTVRVRSLDDGVHPTAPRRLIPDEVDREEWSDHVAAAPTDASYEVDDVQLRPVPRRAGRGGFDPEAAEATRAYRYQQRRRVALVLLIATLAFTVASLVLAGWLWAGAAVSALLLVGYLGYLRRQVKIEATIRQRRMERLQRARQIRPEYQRPPRRTRGGLSAVAPGRTVVDLDDDDPGFDELEPYHEPLTYRRASGQ